MKRFMVLTVCALVCVHTFSMAAEEPASTSSSVAVTNVNGSKVVKVYYKGIRVGNVKVAIFNDRDEVVFVEKLKNTSGFMRPYNFEGQREGTYTIQLSDAFGKYTEKVNYLGGRIKTLVRFAKLPGEDRYVLMGRSHSEQNLTVRFFDTGHQLVFEERRKVDGEFGEVYNLKYLPGKFTVEILDEHGLLTSASF